jgi:hypothetical protein
LITRVAESYRSIVFIVLTIIVVLVLIIVIVNPGIVLIIEVVFEFVVKVAVVASFVVPMHGRLSLTWHSF